MEFKVFDISNPKEKQSELMQVWEASVRATHHFVTEGDVF